MRTIGREELRERLPWPALIEAIEDELKAGRVVSPERQNLTLAMPGGGSANLLVMPAWIAGGSIGVKIVTFFPDNGEKGLPTINAAYTLFDGATGEFRAVLEGDELTVRRTAAASALAARFLARADASRLLVVGTGQLSARIASAHASVRAYETIEIWGRRPERAEAVVAELRAEGLPAVAAGDLEASIRRADTISAVTSAAEPLVPGQWVRPGTHVDLVGAFKPDMRESDDTLVAAAKLFVDTRAGALKAGDLAQPIERGIVTEADIAADLAEIARGEHPGRRSFEEITLFKSAGSALLDLAAARLATGSV